MSGRERMDVSCLIDGTRPLDRILREQVVGQDGALGALICAFARLLSGLRDPSRPLLTGLLLGPTGVGKTATAKALARALFGSERALTRVNCEEYAHAHEISKLLGSPPGYVGYNIEPLLSQKHIEASHRNLHKKAAESLGAPTGLADALPVAKEGKPVSIVLFDEIEKAHPILWNALLGILEDGMLSLGDNSRTDFTRSIILITSNVGSREMSEILEHRPIGFRRDDEAHHREAATVEETALDAAWRVFPFEFLNRFDEILVYSALDRDRLAPIFDKFLAEIHERAITASGVPLLINVNSEAKAWIIERGTDLRFGARPLRRAMETELVDPLSRLIAGGKLRPGDLVEVERDGDRLAFFRGQRAAKILAA